MENVDFRVAFVCDDRQADLRIAYTVASSRLTADVRWRPLRLHGFKCIVVRVERCVRSSPVRCKSPPAKHCSESVRRFVALYGRKAVSRRLNYGSGVTHPAHRWFYLVLYGGDSPLSNCIFQCRKRVLVYRSANSDVLVFERRSVTHLCSSPN